MPSHEGLGSALRNASTVLKSVNSANTELWKWMVKNSSNADFGGADLELLVLVPSHPHSVGFAVLAEEIFQLLLERVVFLRETFLRD